MKVRFGKQLLADMKTASVTYRVSYSRLARMALRKFRRGTDPVPEVRAESTYGGEAIRIDVRESEFPGVTGLEVRQAVTVYLAGHSPSAENPPVNDGGLVAGVDYLVIERS